jgi:hypothetical protein
MSKENTTAEVMVIIMLLVIFGLNFAVDRNVSPKEIDKANEICKNANSSLEKMNVGSFFVDVTCSNSGEFRFPVKYIEDK